MGLFNKQTNLDNKPSDIWQVEPEGAVSCDSVLQYLVGLSDEEFSQINKVAIVYRKADKEASKVLGNENQPTTFINPIESEADNSDDFLIEDEPKPKKGKK